MAENKKSFLLYCDIMHTVKKLSNEQTGILFKHILSYVNDENPELNDLMLELVFEPIKQQLKRDLRRYENICNKNKTNGEKGGRPNKINTNNPNNPVGKLGILNNPNNPDEPKKPDNDNDNDNDNDIGIDKKIFITAQKWMKENSPSVLKLKEPFTEKQFTQLRTEFSNDQIKHLLLKMHNWEPLLKKSKSANLTFRNWSKRETFKDMIIDKVISSPNGRKPETEDLTKMTGLEYLTYGLKPEYR
jgi:hypothetical protein